MARRFRYKDIQLPQLRSFCVAATQGNFTAAAKLLGLAAPTVWEQVRALERRLGANLLLRKGRLVEITSEGKLLLSLVQPHVSGLDSLEKLFEAERSTLPQRLVLASTPNILAQHLVGPVGQFVKQYPSVLLNLRPSWRIGDSVQMVEQGGADLGVVPYFPEEPGHPAIQVDHLYDMRFTLLTAADHPLAQARVVKPADLVEYPIIMGQEGTHSRVALERLLRRHGVLDQARIVLESSHAEVIRSYVAAGVGIAVLYVAGDAHRYMPGLHLRPFDAKIPGLPVGLITRKGAHLAEPVEVFRAIVRKALSQ